MQKEVALLQLKNSPIYQKNLDKILHYLKTLPDDTIVVAPEVCLTDYDYENLDKACEFGEYAIEELIKSVNSKTLILTILVKSSDNYYNEAIVISRGKIIHKQRKQKLFKLGNEHLFLKAGDGSDIVKFDVDGIECGLLICFELRYKELWQKLEGAEIIFAPSQWGMPRKRHLEIISNALAVVNQCYLLVANSAKEGMASSSAIYAPMGGVVMDDARELIRYSIDLNQVRIIRRYIKLDN